MQTPNTFFKVTSSNGEINAHKENGQVISIIVHEGGDKSFADIKKLNIEEYLTYKALKEMPDTVDILDLGYWYENNPNAELKYEEPAHDWRKERDETQRANEGWNILPPTEENAEQLGIYDLDGPDKIKNILTWGGMTPTDGYWILEHESGKFSTVVNRDSEYGSFAQCKELLKEVVEF